MSASISRKLMWLLGVGFALQMALVTQPPLEPSHSWRQATGLMVARNFAKGDANILHPRIDEHPETSGEVNMEFPLLPWLHGQLGRVFGYKHWYSRLLNVLALTLGLASFFMLVRRVQNEQVALLATSVLAVSMWFSFGRKAMPDVFSCAVVLMGMEALLRAVDRKAWWRWLAAVLLLSLGVLSKLPAALLMFPLFVVFFVAPSRVKLKLVLVATAVGASLLWWYGFHGPALAKTSGIWYHQGQPAEASIQALFSHWPEVWERFSVSALKSYVAFGMVLFGMWTWVQRRQEDRLLGWVLLALSVGCAMLMFKAGFYFHHHDYYITPFVPAMALLSGYGLWSLGLRCGRSWSWMVLGAIALEAGLNQQHDWWTPDEELPKLELTALGEEWIPLDEFVVVLGSGNPIELYLLNRKGWIHTSDSPRDWTWYRERGAKWLLIPEGVEFGEIPDAKVVVDNGHHLLLHL